MIHVIVNPSSAAASDSRAWSRIEAAVRAEHDIVVHHTAGPGDGSRIAAGLVSEGRTTIVVVVGGDGSLHDVVNGLLETPSTAPLPTLVVWPSGSGNDFARSLGAHPSLDALLAALRGSATRLVDAWQVSWPGGNRWFVNVASFGLTARAVELATWPGVRVSPGRYVAGAIRALWRGADFSVRLSLDQAPMAAAHLAAGVLANGSWFGAGMPIAPGAVLDDGRLDCISARAASRPRLLGLLARVVTGRHLASPLVARQRVSSLVLEWQGDLPFEMDGETVRVASPVEVRCTPGALRVSTGSSTTPGASGSRSS